MNKIIDNTRTTIENQFFQIANTNNNTINRTTNNFQIALNQSLNEIFKYDNATIRTTLVGAINIVKPYID